MKKTYYKLDRSEAMSIDEKPVVFALDIGTRSVIGIVGQKNDDKFNIIDVEYTEHKNRAMYDGQIHDIQEVSKMLRIVKENLEERNNLKLEEVSIAAAGRALLTKSYTYKRSISKEIEIEDELVNNFEIEAIQKLQSECFEKEEDFKKYHYVGHSVLTYYLDDMKIDSLSGHRGEKLTVDLIATFLPETVVESLYTCVSKAGMSVKNMTLEPIAAIEFAVPKDIRLLNLALVDIGAGTSDIAITKDGTVTAFDMVDIAGDEITEQIAQKLLVGFNEADKIKRRIADEEVIRYLNVLGMEEEVKSEDLVELLKDTINELGIKISNRIMETNGKQPSAVFLVGGGAQIPMLAKNIADELKLNPNRVVVRGASELSKIEINNEYLKGPQGITPLGIAISTPNIKENNVIEILLNGERKSFFNIKKYKISDVLIDVGFNPRKLIPKMKNQRSFSVNGEEKIVKGLTGEAAEIRVNGNKVGLDYKIKSLDEIVIKDAIEAEKPICRIKDYIEKRKILYLENKEYSCISNIFANNVLVNEEYLIKDKDVIIIEYFSRFGEFVDKYKINKDICNLENIIIDKTETIVFGKRYFFYNNKKIDISIDDDFDSELMVLKVTVNGEKKIIKHNKKSFIFVNLFDYIDFDLTKAKGRLMLRVNEEPAEFQQIINQNDVISIYWE